MNGINDLRGEKRRPAGFDGPADLPVRVRDAESGDGGEGVEDVAHGAGAEDEEAG